MKTTITSSNHGLQAGDMIETRVPDTRWWMRLWHFVTFRSPPMKRETWTIKSTTATTITMK